LHIQHNQLTKSDRKAWAEFVSNHPDNTVFQSPEMFDFYEKVNNYTPHIFLGKDDDGVIRAVLLAVVIKEYDGWRGRLSSRTIVYGGPLTDETFSRHLQLFREILRTLTTTLKKQSVYIQFRNFIEWPEMYQRIFISEGYGFTDRLNLLVPTTDKSETKKLISKSKRRQIKKGKENGSVVRPPENREEVKIFYNLIRDLYKNRVRKPLPDLSFFEEFFEMSRQNSLGIFRLVVSDGHVIGGVVAPVTPGRNIYEWYLFGLDSAYKKKYPSVLATWTPIQYGLKNNLQHFDFMGLGTPAKPYGVRDFKLHFGKNTTNPGRFNKINNKYLYFITEISYNILRLFRKV
jgi:lipid II:glycine glycyltransferase (peptidoglycan interpeptide bridge formation enzyme)